MYPGSQGRSTVTDQSPSCVSLTIITTCENEATRTESFQQYLTETFPEDGKCSTSGVFHKLDSTVNTCWKTLTVLGKLPHVWKWLQLLPFVLGISRSASLKTVCPACIPFGQFINRSAP